MSNFKVIVPLLLAGSASLAQADALTQDRIHVVQPQRNVETAVHKPGRIAWCDGKYTGEVWDADRVLRAIHSDNADDWMIDTNWAKGVEHMCQFADDPIWQRQATYVIQSGMNGDSDKSQDEIVAKIKRLIAASQKQRANADRVPTDEDRFAFEEQRLEAVAPERGVDTAKLASIPWCDGVKISEKWDAGRIDRNSSSKDGIVESALHLCQRPNDATWKQKASLLLQSWMNWTKQTQPEAIASIKVRIQMDKVTAERESMCKGLVPGGELAGAGKAYALAKQKLFGCEDDRQGETWQGNQNFVSEETGYYIDGSDAVESELARIYWLFGVTSTPRTDLPANNAPDNKQLLAYAAVANEMANLDEKNAAAEMSRAPFAGNGLARAIVSESIATLRWRKKLYDAAIDKLAGSDADYAAILRNAAKEGAANWSKITAPWKTELDKAFAFEQKLATSSRNAMAGCSKDFEGVVGKLIKSYKSNDYQTLLQKIGDDPIASLLLSRISLCYGLDKLPTAGMLRDLYGTSRPVRGRRTYAYFAIVDKLAEVKKNRPRLLLELANFYNPYDGGRSDRESSSDVRMSGAVPTDPNDIKSRGVVGKVTKKGAGIHVEFKKVTRIEPVYECKETDRISHIDGNGNVIYRRNCWDTGKTRKVDLTPAPQDVPAEFAAGIKPGVFVGISYDGSVPYVKANADAKTITTFLGYSL